MLSVQQINTLKINENTESFIKAKETDKNKKTKLNHQQDYRILLRNSFEILPIKACYDKAELLGQTGEGNSILPSFDHAPSKRRHKKQSTKHSKQPEAYITNKQYKESLEQRKTCIVQGRRTYSEATKFGKKICVTGDSHLNRIKRSIKTV